jgi:hypothetical protein
MRTRKRLRNRAGWSGLLHMTELKIMAAKHGDPKEMFWVSTTDFQGLHVGEAEGEVAE